MPCSRRWRRRSRTPWRSSGSATAGCRSAPPPRCARPPDHRETPASRAGRLARRRTARRTVSLEREPALRDLYTTTGRGCVRCTALPIAGRREPRRDDHARQHRRLARVARLGGAPLFRRPGGACARAGWRFVQEHELAVQLQRSLLPERCRVRRGRSSRGTISRAPTRSRSGATGTTRCGGRTGSVHLCVGDVSGKGIGAATVMSRKRHTFEVYADDLTSPAEIVRRMLRHADGDEMVTVGDRHPRSLHRRAHVLVRRSSAAAAARPGLGRGDEARRRECASGGRRRCRSTSWRRHMPPARPGAVLHVHGRSDRAAWTRTSTTRSTSSAR